MGAPERIMRIVIHPNMEEDGYDEGVAFDTAVPGDGDDYEDDGRKYNSQLQECSCPSVCFSPWLTCIKDTHMSVSGTKY